MITYYDEEGRETTAEKALYAHTKTDKVEAWYVKAYKSRLFDPFNMIDRDRQLGWVLKNVSEDVYKNYVQFVTTRSIKYKYFAERLI